MDPVSSRRGLVAAFALPLALVLSTGCDSDVDVRWPGGRVGVAAGRGGARVNVRTPGAGVRVNAGRRGTAVDVRVPGGRIGVNARRPPPGALPPGWRSPPPMRVRRPPGDGTG
jgi:hypothetical protein